MENNENENMKCLRCGEEMVTANLLMYPASQPVVQRTRKGLLSAPVQSGTQCLVCIKCGYIELRATQPHKLKFRTE